MPVPPGRLCACTNSRDAASRPAYAMPRESTLGGRDVAKVGERASSVKPRYARNPYDIVSVKCGALRQGVAASIVFAVSLSQDFFAHRQAANTVGAGPFTLSRSLLRVSSCGDKLPAKTAVSPSSKGGFHEICRDICGCVGAGRCCDSAGVGAVAGGAGAAGGRRPGRRRCAARSDDPRHQGRGQALGAGPVGARRRRDALHRQFDLHRPRRHPQPGHPRRLGPRHEIRRGRAAAIQRDRAPDLRRRR